MDIKFVSLHRTTVVNPYSGEENREGRSKVLDPNSELYASLDAIRKEITKRGYQTNSRMDLHIEVLGKSDDANDDELLNRRSVQLAECKVDTSDLTNYGFIGKAFAFNTPAVEGYGQTHVTLAFKPGAELGELLDIVKTVTS